MGIYLNLNENFIMKFEMLRKGFQTQPPTRKRKLLIVMLDFFVMKIVIIKIIQV